MQTSRMNPAAKQIVTFSAISGGVVALVVLLIWAMSGFVSLRSIGLSGNVLAALVLGITLSTALAVGLMALIFFSDRSDRDEVVYRSTADRMGDPAAAGPHTERRRVQPEDNTD